MQCCFSLEKLILIGVIVKYLHTIFWNQLNKVAVCYFSAMPEAVEAVREPIDPKLMMSISAKSDPFKTYGYLIGRLTEGHRIYMRCTGIAALHAATKSLAISRAKIRDHSILRGDDICLRIAHQEGAQENKITKYIISVDRVSSDLLSSPTTEEESIRCSSKSRPKEVGGNMLISLEDNKDVLGKAMGQLAIATLMAGYAVARKRILAKGTDLVCFPEYREEEVPGKVDKVELRHVLNLMLRKVAYDPLKDVRPDVSGDDGKTDVVSTVTSKANTILNNGEEGDDEKEEDIAEQKN